MSALPEVVIFAGHANGFLQKALTKIAATANMLKMRTTFFGAQECESLCTGGFVSTVGQSDLPYLVKNFDHRIYDGFLQYLSDDVRRIGYIPRLLLPEFLMSSLMGTRQQVRVSWSQFGAELYKTPGRRALMQQLASLSVVENIFVHSIGLQPAAALPLECCHDKMVFLPEPTYEPDHLYYSSFAASSAKYSVGFFGALSFGKGLDIFAEALRRLSQPMPSIICGDPASLNFDFSFSGLPSFCTQQLGSVSDVELVSAIRNCRIIVLPYRKYYEFGTSGIFHQAMLLHRRVVVPDFNPFSATATELGVGYTFVPESAPDLARVMEVAVAEVDPAADTVFLNYPGRQDVYSAVLSSLGAD